MLGARQLPGLVFMLVTRVVLTVYRHVREFCIYLAQSLGKLSVIEWVCGVGTSLTGSVKSLFDCKEVTGKFLDLGREIKRVELQYKCYRQSCECI